MIYVYVAGNPCIDDIDGKGTPHRLLTIALHKRLRVLDGFEVTQDDRVAAAQFVSSLPVEAQEQIDEMRAWTPLASVGEDVAAIQAAYRRNAARSYAVTRKGRCV